MSAADVIWWVGSWCVFCGAGIWISTILRPDPALRHAADGLYAVGYWLLFLASVMVGSPVAAAVFGLLAIWCTWLWWRNRRKGRGRKALRELGAKSRARIEALVRQMTPSPIPSPAGA